MESRYRGPRHQSTTFESLANQGLRLALVDFSASLEKVLVRVFDDWLSMQAIEGAACKAIASRPLIDKARSLCPALGDSSNVPCLVKVAERSNRVSGAISDDDLRIVQICPVAALQKQLSERGLSVRDYLLKWPESRRRSLASPREVMAQLSARYVPDIWLRAAIARALSEPSTPDGTREELRRAVEASAWFPEKLVYTEWSHHPEVCLEQLLAGSWMNELQPAILAFESTRAHRLDLLKKFVEQSKRPVAVVMRALVALDTETNSTGKISEIGFATFASARVHSVTLDPQALLAETYDGPRELLQEVAAGRPLVVGHNLTLHDKPLIHSEWGVDLSEFGTCVDTMLVSVGLAPWKRSHSLPHHPNAHRAGADAEVSLQLLIQSLADARRNGLLKLLASAISQDDVSLEAIEAVGQRAKRLPEAPALRSFGRWSVCDQHDIRQALWSGCAQLTSRSVIDGAVLGGSIASELIQAKLDESLDEAETVLLLRLLGHLIGLAKTANQPLYQAMLPSWLSLRCQTWIDEVTDPHFGQVEDQSRPVLLPRGAAIRLAVNGFFGSMDVERLFAESTVMDWIGTICRESIPMSESIPARTAVRALPIPAVFLSEKRKFGSSRAIEVGVLAAPRMVPQKVLRLSPDSVPIQTESQQAHDVTVPMWCSPDGVQDPCVTLWPDTSVTAYGLWVNQTVCQVVSLLSDSNLKASVLILLCESADARNRIEDILARPEFGLAEVDLERSLKARLQRALRSGRSPGVLCVDEAQWWRLAPSISEFDAAERESIALAITKIPIELWMDWLPSDRVSQVKTGFGETELARLRAATPAWLHSLDVVGGIALVVLDARIVAFRLTDGPRKRMVLRELNEQQRLALGQELGDLSQLHSTSEAMSLDACRRFLTEWWGHPDFTLRQTPGMQAILEESRPVLVTLPTGEGKSVMFQVPALLHAQRTGQLSIVCMPLKALMKDQFENVPEGLKPRVAYLSSDMPWWERAGIIQRIFDGQICLLFVAPERLAQPQLQEVIEARASRDGGLGFFIFDEVHCLVEWGFGFRPGYLKCLKYVRDQLLFAFPTTRMLLFSATVTGRTRVALAELLRSSRSDAQPVDLCAVPEEAIWPLQDFVDLRVIQMEDADTDGKPETFVAMRRQALVDAIVQNDVLAHRASSAIVFCRRRSETETVIDQLSENVRVHGEPFHAGMTSIDRSEAYDRIRRKRTRLIAATSAFGMGMDVPNLHCCVHLSPPSSIEQLVQEIGRVGRSRKAREAAGLRSIDATVLVARQDLERLRELHERNRIRIDEVQQLWDALRRADCIESSGNTIVFADEGIVSRPGVPRVSSTNFDRMLFWLEEADLLTVEGLLPRAFKMRLNLQVLRNLRSESGDVGAVVDALLDLCENIPERIPAEAQRNRPITQRGTWFSRLFERCIGLVFGRAPAQVSQVEDMSAASVKTGASLVSKDTHPWSIVPLARLAGALAKVGIESQTRASHQLTCRALQVLRKLHRVGAVGLDRRISFRAMGELKEAESVLRSLETRAIQLLQQDTLDSADFSRSDPPEVAIDDSQALPESDEARKKRQFVRREDRALLALLRNLRIIVKRSGSRADADSYVRRYPFRANQGQELRLVKRLMRAALAIAVKCIQSGESADRSDLKAEIDLGWLLSVVPQTQRCDALAMFGHVVSMMRTLRLVDCMSEALPSVRAVTMHCRRAVNLVGVGDVSPDDRWAHDRIATFVRRENEAEERLRAMDVLLGLERQQDRNEFIQAYFAAGSDAELHDALRQAAQSADLSRLVMVDDQDIGAIQELRSRRSAVWLSDLSSNEKRDAVMAPPDSHVLVNAGPGSGKTHLLISRALYHINQGVRPSEILILAFNRAVVSDIRKRVFDALRGSGFGNYGRGIECRTFHSYALTWLRKWGISLQELRKETGGDVFDAGLREFVAQLARTDRIEEIVGGKRMVMIDEWQDCNFTRWQFVERLLQGKDSLGLLCIGDDDQDILRYERRRDPKDSGNNDYFKKLKELCKKTGLRGVRGFVLSENLRSHAEIVDYSQAFISGANLTSPRRRKAKVTLQSEQLKPGEPLPGGRVVEVSLVNEGRVTRGALPEGAHPSFSTETFARLLDEMFHVGYRSIAVLVRTRAEARARFQQIQQARELCHHSFGSRLWQSDDVALFKLREFAEYELALKLDSSRALNLETELASRVRLLRLPSLGSTTGGIEERSPATRIGVLLQYVNDAQGCLRTSDVLEAIRDMKLSDLEKATIAMTGGDGLEVDVRTIHSSKGLEYDAVILCGSEDSSQSGQRDDEARLWYVGMTRARQSLIVMETIREQTLFKEAGAIQGGPVRGAHAEVKRLDVLDLEQLDINSFSENADRWKLWRYELQSGDLLTLRNGVLFWGGGSVTAVGRLSRRGREVIDAFQDSRWRIVEVYLHQTSGDHLGRLKLRWPAYPGHHYLPWRLESCE